MIVYFVPLSSNKGAIIATARQFLGIIYKYVGQ